MKNLNTRTKMLLAIAGVVIVVVIAGILFMGPADDLFGATVIHISPENPTISVGQVLDLSINSLYGCSWTSGYDIAPFVAGVTPWGSYSTALYLTETKSVQVIGRGPGQAVITAKCPFNTRTTTVTVR